MDHEAAPAGAAAGGGAWSGFSRHAPQVLFELTEVAYGTWARSRLDRLARRFGPDLIYDRYALFNTSPAAVASRRGIPLVTEINDATFVRRSRGLVMRGLARRRERRVLDGSTAIVTVSQRFREMLLEAHPGVPAPSVLVTPNAVDPRRFAGRDGGGDGVRERLGLAGRTVVGAVGAFVPWHGLDHLVESVEGLLRRRDDVEVLLVGDGPVRADAEALARRLGLADRVRFTGFVPPAEVPAYIAAMDVCLMPDSNEHGSPIKIFEYMAMGRAAVAPRYGPIEEVLEHGRTGMLFTPRDRGALATTIETLVGDPELRARLGACAREAVLERHTWRANAETVLSALGHTARDAAAAEGTERSPTVRIG